MWFEDLVGFAEEHPDQVRANLEASDELLRSKVNGRTFGCGELTTPSLEELRAETGCLSEHRDLVVEEVVADVQALHLEPAAAGACFQVASQFNLLEMTGPGVTPENGVGIYEYDRTQGPACAIACGAGTVYRNYFADVGNGQVGQTAARQIDCLADLGQILGNDDDALWSMQNGYALASLDGLRAIGELVAVAGEQEREALRGKLRIGVHSNVEVTLKGAGHRVTQIYASALPVAYSEFSADHWEPFARLVLEASYEATLRAAAIQAGEREGACEVYLTRLGGGAFGNRSEWIIDAVRRALHLVEGAGLRVRIVSYGGSQPDVAKLAGEFSEY